eukprot:Lithocolla_globosa_v1_NODE_7689_length_913_cov_1134.116550.p2 type:complete len:107 gc:universal NODE_7689_length_913_cov_1134.116550:152-472(+)
MKAEKITALIALLWTTFPSVQVVAHSLAIVLLLSLEPVISTEVPLKALAVLTLVITTTCPNVLGDRPLKKPILLERPSKFSGVTMLITRAFTPTVSAKMILLFPPS